MSSTAHAYGRRTGGAAPNARPDSTRRSGRKRLSPPRTAYRMTSNRPSGSPVRIASRSASTDALTSASLSRTPENSAIGRSASAPRTPSERDVLPVVVLRFVFIPIFAAARGAAPGLRAVRRLVGVLDLEVLGLHPALLVLEQDLDLPLGLVQLPAEEARQLDPLLEQGQRLV